VLDVGVLLSRDIKKDPHPSFIVIAPEDIQRQIPLSFLVLLVQVIFKQATAERVWVCLFQWGNLFHLVLNICHQVIKFFKNPLEVVFRHIVEFLLKTLFHCVVLVVIEVVWVVDVFVDDVSIIPVKRRITLGAEHLETPGFFFNGDTATGATPAQFRHLVEGFDNLIPADVMFFLMTETFFTHPDPA